MLIRLEHFNIGIIEKVVEGTPYLAVAIADTNSIPLGQMTVHSMVSSPELERPQEVLLLKGM